MGRRLRMVTVVTVCVALLAGCATKEQTGLATGAVAGAAAGAAVGGRYRGLAIVGGALLGGLVGTLIGRELDEADRRRANQAAEGAARDGQRIVWNSEKNPNIRGYAEPVGPVYRQPGPAVPAPVTAAGKVHCFDAATGQQSDVEPGQGCPGAGQPMSEEDYAAWRASQGGTATARAPDPAPRTTDALACRRVREVVIIDGQEKKEEAEYCRRNGTWARAA